MKIDFEQNPSSQEHARQIGVALMLMLQCRKYQFYPLVSLQVWIDPAILLRQIRFFFDYKGNPIAYITWAYLAHDVEERLLRDPKVLFHLSEWNEGDRLWIMDFVAMKGYAKSVIEVMRNNMFSGLTEARSLRRTATGEIRSVNVWRRNA